MRKIEILTPAFRKCVKISESDFNVLKAASAKLGEVSKFVNQYAVFKKNLNSFEREVMSHAIDVKQADFDDFFTSHEVFARADHIVVSHLAAFMRFPELMPSHLEKILKAQSEKEWALTQQSELYDDPETFYAFLCELRNAIVHSNVALVVSEGARVIEPSTVGLNTFGYFIDFDRFVEESVIKVNKQKILNEMKSKLCNKRGRVDLVKAFLRCAQAIFIKMVDPKLPEINDSFESVLESIDQILIENELPSMRTFSSQGLDDYLVIGGSELELSKVTVTRARKLLATISIHTPLSILSIAPSLQET